MKYSRLFLLCAGLSGSAAVALDAAGAHTLANVLDARRLAVLNTAVRLAEVHAVLLVAVSLALAPRGDEARVEFNRALSGGPWLGWSATGLVLGLVLFFGGLSAYALSGVRLFGHAAPVGGLCWIGAWILLALHGVRRF